MLQIELLKFYMRYDDFFFNIDVGTDLFITIREFPVSRKGAALAQRGTHESAIRNTEQKLTKRKRLWLLLKGFFA